jgi:hypothetical protein
VLVRAMSQQLDGCEGWVYVRAGAARLATSLFLSQSPLRFARHLGLLFATRLATRTPC